ncbi:hypothetical protein BJV82DRAFT_560959 [Fennellomyces sp. T-0311]|nr:hypothetical protein BJV82DRAFT_560959 [Fennellomyces sp. T-0311]
MSSEERKPEDLFGFDHDEDEQIESPDEEQEEDARFSKRRLRQAQDLFDLAKKNDSDESDSDEDVEEEEEEKEEEETGMEGKSSQIESAQEEKEEEGGDGNDEPVLDNKKKKKKVKKLTPEELEAFEKEQKNTGVCYLSRIPMFMTPTRVRDFLSEHAELGRIYLEREDARVTAKRRKFHKNKRVNYTEGWVEFKDKRQAKRLASFLNARQVGGKRGNAFYYETWTIKYLPKFKWRHLTEQMAYEKKARERRLEAELAQATRENKLYIENVEKAKMHKGMRERNQKKRKLGVDVAEKPEEDIRRSFKQRNKVVTEVESQRPGEGKEALGRLDDSVKNVLSKVLGK